MFWDSAIGILPIFCWTASAVPLFTSTLAIAVGSPICLPLFLADACSFAVEVAMVRDKYPERVPFRLTRMLVQAMEVSGIEGTFRITCENSMRVLRDNKESIMAVLEAFVHDPLINWRLINSSKKGRGEGGAGGGGGGEGRGGGRGKVEEMGPMDEEQNEALNQRALAVVDRVQQKLTGRDFKPKETLDVREQVQRLIIQATSVENLCQTFIGWCAL